MIEENTRLGMQNKCLDGKVNDKAIGLLDKPRKKELQHYLYHEVLCDMCPRSVKRYNIGIAEEVLKRIKQNEDL